MAKKAAPAPLPAVEALPASALDHPTLHAIVHAKVQGRTLRDIAAKHGLHVSFVRKVVAHYLR